MTGLSLLGHAQLGRFILGLRPPDTIHVDSLQSRWARAAHAAKAVEKIPASLARGRVGGVVPLEDDVVLAATLLWLIEAVSRQQCSRATLVAATSDNM